MRKTASKTAVPVSKVRKTQRIVRWFESAGGILCVLQGAGLGRAFCHVDPQPHPSCHPKGRAGGAPLASPCTAAVLPTLQHPTYGSCYQHSACTIHCSGQQQRSNSGGGLSSELSAVQSQVQLAMPLPSLRCHEVPLETFPPCRTSDCVLSPLINGRIPAAPELSTATAWRLPSTGKLQQTWLGGGLPRPRPPSVGLCAIAVRHPRSGYQVRLPTCML